MSGAPTPPLLLEPIANSAPNGSAAGDKTNPMPDAPTGSNAASVQGGFPAITMESELAGGLPPLGQDMNGFMFLISSHTMALQCGQPYLYNATLATKIGGYAQGTILGSTSGRGLWVNQIGGNTSDPDAGGVGWGPLAMYGIALPSTTGGTVTLSPGDAKYPIINLSGALTDNVLLVFPNRFGQWLVINNTTGSFTVTASAGGQNTVPIPAGGPGAPTGVYCIGDTNMYPLVSPLSVPIDQAPNPLTLAERTNAGYLLAQYFHQSSGLEAPTVGAVFVENTAEDGFLRKIPLANFAAQLFGDAPGDPGVLQLGNGFKLQYGSIYIGDVISPPSGTIAFPEPFASFCHVFPSLTDANGTHASAVPGIDGTPTLFGFNWTAREISSQVQSCTYHWFAIGV